MSPLSADAICTPSEDIVAREIEGELIIIPLTAGIGDMEDELYTLNETGKAVWGRLDGSATLGEIAKVMAGEYDAPPAEIERDLLGLMEELARRKIVTVK